MKFYLRVRSIIFSELWKFFFPTSDYFYLPETVLECHYISFPSVGKIFYSARMGKTFTTQHFYSTSASPRCRKLFRRENILFHPSTVTCYFEPEEILGRLNFSQRPKIFLGLFFWNLFWACPRCFFKVSRSIFRTFLFDLNFFFFSFSFFFFFTRI